MLNYFRSIYLSIHNESVTPERESQTGLAKKSGKRNLRGARQIEASGLTPRNTGFHS